MLRDGSLCFLIGAGVSQAAGLPSVTDITKSILCGKNIINGQTIAHLKSQCDFVPPDYEQSSYPNNYVSSIIKFLKILKRQVINNKTRQGRLTANDLKEIKKNPNFYEYLSYLNLQIKYYLDNEYENLALYDFIKKINKKLQQQLVTYELEELVDKTNRYIKDFIRLMLENNPNCHLESHDFLKECLKTSTFKDINIFTLNNDTLLEKSLKTEKLDYIDGFGKPINSIRYWEPENYFNETVKIKLLKLHGSIDWFQLQNDDTGETYITMLSNGPFNTFRDPNNQELSTTVNQSIILVGTINKLMSYTSSLFGELSWLFWLKLKNCKRLVITGYSFNDRGINTRLIDWLNRSFENKIIIIHPNKEQLLDYSAPYIKREFPDKYERLKQIHYIEKKIEETNWSDINSVMKVM